MSDDVRRADPADATGPDDEPVTVNAGYRTGLHVGPETRPDRYELFGPPRRGGEGTTWRANYLGALDRPVMVAIKVLQRPPSMESVWPDEATLDRWRDRVELLRSADIPGLVRLYDVEIAREPHREGERDTPFTAIVEMEWVEGRSLDAEIDGAPATAGELAERIGWLADLAGALAGLHGLDSAAVHRDVTPANCMVTPARRLVLVDLSTIQLPVDQADLLGRHTPKYSAPEVLAAPYARRAPAADRWALGAIAYLCLTGCHPARSSAERVRTLTATAGRLRASEEAVRLMLQMLDDDPASRPTDLSAWVASLQRAVGAGAPSVRRRSPNPRPVSKPTVTSPSARPPARKSNEVPAPTRGSASRRIATAAILAAAVAVTLSFVPVPIAVVQGVPAARHLAAAMVCALIGVLLTATLWRRAKARVLIAAPAMPLAAGLVVLVAYFVLGRAGGMELAALSAAGGLLAIGLAALLTRLPARPASGEQVAAISGGASDESAAASRAPRPVGADSVRT